MRGRGGSGRLRHSLRDPLLRPLAARGRTEPAEGQVCGSRLGREPLLQRLRQGVAGTVGWGIRDADRVCGDRVRKPGVRPCPWVVVATSGPPRSRSFRAVFVWGPHPSLNGRSNPERFRKRRFGQGARELESAPHFASGRWTEETRAGGGRCGPRKGEKEPRCPGFPACPSPRVCGRTREDAVLFYIINCLGSTGWRPAGRTSGSGGQGRARPAEVTAGAPACPSEGANNSRFSELLSPVSR